MVNGTVAIPSHGLSGGAIDKEGKQALEILLKTLWKFWNGKCRLCLG